MVDCRLKSKADMCKTNKRRKQKKRSNELGENNKSCIRGIPRSVVAMAYSMRMVAVFDMLYLCVA